MAEIYTENPLIKILMLKGQDGKDGEDKLINQADGSGLRFWIGTQAEYDAIPPAELIANCVYYITDNTADDLRTEINAIDTKVDNNYTGLQSQIMSTRTYLLGALDQVVAQMNTLSDSLTYKAGDTGTIAVNTAGYVTSNGGLICLTISLPKMLPDDRTITGTLQGKFRQNGQYVGGSSQTDNITFVGNQIAITVTDHRNARIALGLGTPDASFLNAINNETIGIECELNYTIS